MRDKKESLNLIHETGLIPIIRVDSSETCMEVVEAFLAGGVNIIEITFSVPGAIDIVKELSKKMGDDVLIGTGTVLDGETARKAINAGAEFVVSPGYSKDLIEACKELSKPCIPGALTPTEILEAYSLGADAVKVFPCGTVGGASYIKAVRAPLPHIPLVPTGGVNLETAGAFLDAGAFALGVGGAITDKKAIRDGRYDVITNNVVKFLKIIQDYRKK
ncbi:MAG: bifunctional 4-hydroxy-2-oxoglutarate aldolase/2-dehydro-3-deoxy-phosphogluconate aldolase [Candidatus Thorarchaeota archaeon]|jgi:2-dehydro-3-deoxyphosphogluconate aldolase/(4S)-4-hydroxy-2-oxoglutarate aldolase